MKLELTSISIQSVGPKIHDIIQYLYNAINPSKTYQERRKTWGNRAVQKAIFPKEYQIIKR